MIDEIIDLSWHAEDRHDILYEIIGRFCVNLDESIDVGWQISSDLAAIFWSLPSRRVRKCLETTDTQMIQMRINCRRRAVHSGDGTCRVACDLPSPLIHVQNSPGFANSPSETGWTSLKDVPRLDAHLVAAVPLWNMSRMATVNPSILYITIENAMKYK